MADVFEDKSSFSYAMISLKDKLRPVFRMNREGGRYTLETACYIELLGCRIPDFEIRIDEERYYEKRRMGEYNQLLKNEDLCNLLDNNYYIEWKKTINDIKNEIETTGEPVLIRVDSLCNFDSGIGEDDRIAKLLARALVQKNFELSWKDNGYGAMQLMAMKERERGLTKIEEIFPPLFFVEEQGHNDTILLEAERVGRYFINSNHPFAKWFCQEAENLFQMHRGIFNKMEELLCYAEQGELIHGINEILKQIELRSGKRIPEEVWLDNDDFINRW